MENITYSIDFVKKIPLAKYRLLLDKALKQLINAAKPYNIQFEIKGQKTGTIKTVQSIAQYNSSKNIVYGVIKDITEETRSKRDLIKAKNRIKQLNERLSIANHAVSNGVWDWNLETDELIWDDLMYEIYGAEKGEVSLNYQKWENAVHQEDLKFAKKKIAEVVENKGILDFQFRINHPQKGIRYIRGFAKFVELNNPHLIGVNFDNTERVHNLARIEKSEKQFRQLFEENSDIIAILSPEGKLQNINCTGLKEFNLSPNKLNNISFADLTPQKGDKEHSIEVIQKLKNHQQVAPYYKQFVGCGNKVKDYEVSVSAIYDSDDNLQQIISIIRNISERIKYEKELLKQTKKAEESDRLKTAFLMNMSHEIRTPLNAIMGFSAILRETALSETQLEFVSHIQKGSNRLLDTVVNLLEASQLQQGQFKLNIKECNIQPLLAELYYKVKNLYEDRLSSIELIFNSNITEDTTLLTDESRLKSILFKIIDNAFKFTTKGSVIIDCVETDSYVDITIKDTGSGIEPEKLKLIFDVFRQGEDSISRGYEGLGLGLPIAKGIVELMGGQIDVISEPKMGTNISIRMPRNQPSIKYNRSEKTKKKNILGKCNILIIEDDEDSSRYLEIILKNIDKKLTIARDGRSCKSLIKSNNFNIIFVDLKLPDISGLELIPIIRKKLPQSQIVVLSAYASQATIEEALDLGADQYLTKPVEKKKILKIVKNCGN